MSKLNHQTHDAQIMLASDHQRGFSAYELTMHTPKGNRSYRAALTLPTEASAHTLELFALTAALQTLNKAKREQLTGASGRAPRIEVLTKDAAFADGLRSVLSAGAETPLRAGGNFKDAALKQFSRFSIDVMVEQDNSIFVLRNWGQQHVFDPKEILGADAIFGPAAVGALAPSYQF